MLKKILASVYEQVTKLRNWAFDRGIFFQYRSSLPVVSIGNITVGGNGKTPLVLLVAARLKDRGYRPCILSRGYGGTISGPYEVKQNDAAKNVGDEPLMMARSIAVPVVIARKRVEGAKYIEKYDSGDCIILDDGFQHRWLQRDVDVVTINVATKSACEAFKEGKLLPDGLFREDRDAALKRATIVVLAERTFMRQYTTDSASMADILGENTPLFRSYFRELILKSPRGVHQTPSHEVVLVSGIANPEGFERSVAEAGHKVIASHFFPDHHEFSSGELRNVRKRYPAASILCTEKDEVKINEFPDDNWYVVQVPLTISDEADFMKIVIEKCSSRKDKGKR